MHVAHAARYCSVVCLSVCLFLCMYVRTQLRNMCCNRQNRFQRCRLIITTYWHFRFLEINSQRRTKITFPDKNGLAKEEDEY